MLNPRYNVRANNLAYVHRNLLHHKVEQHNFFHGDGVVVMCWHDLLFNKHRPNVGRSVQVVWEELVLPDWHYIPFRHRIVATDFLVFS